MPPGFSCSLMTMSQCLIILDIYKLQGRFRLNHVPYDASLNREHTRQPNHGVYLICIHNVASAPRAQTIRSHCSLSCTIALTNLDKLRYTAYYIYIYTIYIKHIYYIYIYTHTCTECVYVYIYIYIYMYVCMYMCVCVYIYIDIHTHTYM